jgi:DNA invertase Pin-like site-specific DNA recombinase
MDRNPVFMRHSGDLGLFLGSNLHNPKIMSISIFYARVSSLDQRTDRQRVNDQDFGKIIEDKCSGSIPMFDRPGGIELLSLIDKGIVKSISIWTIDRCGRDLRDIINFLHFTSEKSIPVHFVSQGLSTLDENGNENPITKMIISILGVVGEMERKQILERQREGIELAKLQGRFHGRQRGTDESPLKFLSKPKNKKAMDLLKKGYKNVEVSRITGLNTNTITKVKRIMLAMV